MKSHAFLSTQGRETNPHHPNPSEAYHSLNQYFNITNGDKLLLILLLFLHLVHF